MLRAALRLMAIVMVFAARGVQAEDTTYALHGTVIDAVNARPIARALVATPDRRLATLSDSDGHFTLPVVFPGAAPVDLTLEIGASHPGYFERLSEVPLGASSTAEVSIRLSPVAVVSGHITAPGVDAASNVAVQLFSRVADEHGGYHWQQVSALGTDSHGDFSFPDLGAGTYTVGTGPWLEDDLYPPRTGPAQQYPPVFYGGSPDVDGALKIDLLAGAAARADLQLHLATYYPVHVPIEDKVGEAGIRLNVPGTSTGTGLSFVYVPDRSVYECWFQRGTHTLNFIAPGDQLYGQITVNVLDATLRSAPVVLKPMVSIPVKVHTQYSHPEQKKKLDEQAIRTGPGQFGRRFDVDQPANVYLSPIEGSTESAFSSEENKQLVVRPLPPGTYEVRANVGYGYIASLNSGSTDLLHAPLLLGPSLTPDPIEVTVRDDGATLDATVDFGSAVLPHSVAVVLAPTDGSNNFEFISTDAKGHGTLRNISPGTYRAFAIQGVNNNGAKSYRELVSSSATETKALSLSALPNQHLTLVVPLIELPE